MTWDEDLALNCLCHYQQHLLLLCSQPFAVTHTHTTRVSLEAHAVGLNLRIHRWENEAGKCSQFLNEFVLLQSIAAALLRDAHLHTQIRQLLLDPNQT